jgi:peptide/nickel transport system permease protein
MTLGYVVRRVLFFLFTVWLAATGLFIIVHVAPGNPISYEVGRMAASGQGITGGAKLIAQYKREFGLNKPVIDQYWSYIGEVAHFNLGYSITSFPTKTTTLIGQALPWTLGLVLTSVVISFVLGSLLGGLLAWRRESRILRSVLSGLIVFAAVPYYLLALGLLYLFAYKTQWLPASGGESALNPGAGLARVGDILEHSLLPGLSLVLALIGYWMLWMRSMMVSIMGSDSLLLAEAKGLPERRIFLRYAMRAAVVPQVTVLAVWLGGVFAGALLVEVMFAYPGLGELLVNAVNNRDYPVVEGVGLVIVTSVALSLLIIDLLYPLIDPRIRYERRGR